MFTEQGLCELKYRQYKHEISKMRYKKKFIAKYQVLKSEMGQIPVCAFLEIEYHTI